MLSIAALLLGAVLLLLAIAERSVARLPLTPALVYLIVGVAGGVAFGAPTARQIVDAAPLLLPAIELAVLVSLVAVGVRLRVPPTWQAWRVALLLAGPGMVVTIVLAALAARAVFGLSWPAAFLLAAVLAPTDPVLASEVQIRSERDRDAVRLSLSAEGGLNDGAALPAVLFALAALGLGDAVADPWSPATWWHDLLWPIGGGALLGLALGRAIGWALRARLARGDGLRRDELFYVAGVLLAYGLAQATRTSAFVVGFVAALAVLLPLRGVGHAAPARTLERAGLAADEHDGLQDFAARLHAFGARCERLVEAALVLALGFAVAGLRWDLGTLLFGLVLTLGVRPLAVMAVVRRHVLDRPQRALLGWFGIRGIGTLYYVAFVIERGLRGAAAEALVAASLAAVALSIVLHGVSATPLMTAYHARRRFF